MKRIFGIDPAETLSVLLEQMILIVGKNGLNCILLVVCKSTLD